MLLYYILLLILLLYFLNNRNIREGFYTADYPCRSLLTDNQYLSHMITHHQVAVDISEKYQPHAKSDALRTIIRELIWIQKYEINLMKEVVQHPTENVSIIDHHTPYMPTVLGITPPNTHTLTTTYCDPHFFKANTEHSHSTHSTAMTDAAYIKHMIPHHQVAIDMSKILLLHTKSDFMIGLAYRVIRDQENEVVKLNEIMKSSTFFR